MRIDFGYSPCPNDTFMFWAWVHQRLSQEYEVRPRLADIQELNRQALDDAPWALTKVSIPTYLDPKVRERYQLMSVGAALGRGCGPLIVSRQPWSWEAPTLLRVAIPGRNTTAFQLAQMAIGPWVREWVELRYDEIMPAVLAHDGVDAGVIIHESRFTYQQLGLECALDLGSWWEQKTGLPLPLGVMLARRDLDPTTVQAVERILQSSISRGWQVLHGSSSEPESKSLWRYLRENAIELEDRTIEAHIGLYVTEFSSDLGAVGHQALASFEAMSRKEGSGRPNPG